MVHVPLAPIGRPRRQFCDDATFAAYVDAVAQRETLLQQRRDEVHPGWGDKYVERVHKKGKLTTRGAAAAARRSGLRPVRVGTFVNYGYEFGDKKLRSPAAGVVTAFARVHGRWCMVIANDNTVASGIVVARETPEKNPAGP